MQVLARACGHAPPERVLARRPHHVRPRHGPPHRHRLRRGHGALMRRRGPDRRRRREPADPDRPRHRVAQGRRARRPARRSGQHRAPSAATRSRSPGSATATARSTTTARTRAARSARARSRRGCCAARGTATTTTRSPARRRRASPTRRRASRSRCATTASTSSSPTDAPHERTVSDVMVETMVDWGVTHVFGMVGHSNLGLRRRHAPPGGARATSRSSASATRARPRSRRRPTASSPAGPRRASRIAGPGLDQPAHRALRRQGRPRAGARASRARCRRRCSAAARSRTSTSTPRSPTSPGYSKTVLPASDHAELMTLALKHAIVERDVAHLVLPDEVQELVVGDGPRRRDRSGGSATTASRRPPPRSTTRCASSRRARRPVIVVGHGARFEMDAVARRSPRRCDAPVLTTFKAKGLVSDHHPLGAGVLGRSGTPVASWLMNESRPARSCSARRSRTTPASRAYKPIVQVDFDPMALGRFHPVTVPGARATSASPRACCVERLARRRRPRRPARRRRRSAGRSGGPRRRGASPTTAGSACRRPRCSTRSTARVPDGRGDRRRRRQPRLLVRPLLRVHRASRS